MRRIYRPSSPVAALLGLIAAVALVTGCGNSNPTPPSSTGSAAASNATPTTPGPTPSPTPVPTRAVATVTLISAIGESADGTPSMLAWHGVQDAASRLGVKAALVTPVSMADLTAAVGKAAGDGTTIVVTVGPQAAQAVLDNAAAHTATQFFELDQTIPDGSPANVHGLAFDEAEAGYLAGFVAASVTTSGQVGLVGDTKTDLRTGNYAAGMKNGATYANPAVGVTVAYANRTNDPQAGHAATASLVAGKADVIVATSDLTGAGAMREACARKAGIVALETDATLLLPDVAPCVVAGVLKRYDVAAREAILRYSGNVALPAVIVFDVAAGGIGVSDFHKPAPAGVADRLAALLAAMKKGPPRPTPSPVPAATDTIVPSAPA